MTSPAPSPRRSSGLHILHRYFLREVLSPTLAALALYTFVMLMNQFFLLAEYAYKYDVPVASLAHLFLLQLPHIVVLTLPMSLLVGLLVATARWAADSELIALSASGISLTALLRPVLILSGAFLLLTGWFSFDLMPRGNLAISRSLFEIFRENLLRNVRPREFSTRLLSGWNVYVDSIDHGEDGDLWRGVLLDPTAAARSGGRHEVFFAREAIPSIDTQAGRLVLSLHDVTVHGSLSSDESTYDVRTLKEYTLVVTPPSMLSQAEETGRNRSVREMTVSELREQEVSLNSSDIGLLRLTHVEIHKRLAIPCACIVFAFLGLGLGATAKRSGRAFGFIASLVVILIYYEAFYAGERLAMTGTLPPWLSMWAGNLLFGAIGLFVFYQRASEGRVLIRLRQAWGELGSGRRPKRSVLAMIEGVDSVDSPAVSPALASLSTARPPAAVLRGMPRLRFPNLLDRYVLREFARIFAIVLGSGLTLYIQVTLFQYLDDIFRYHIPLTTVIQLYVAWMPEILTYVLPVSMLMTTVITFSLLTRTNEVTAMLVGGVSLRRIVAPVVVAAIAITAANFVLYDRILPRSSERYDELNDTVRGVPPRPKFAPARWVGLVGGKRFLHYDSYRPDAGIFYRPELYEVGTTEFRPVHGVTGARGRWEDYRLVIESGADRQFTETGEISSYSPFSELALPFLEQRPDFARDWRNPKYMTYEELLAFINWKSEHESETRELVIELRNKHSFPFITLVMVFIGLPFAFAIGKRGSLLGFLGAIVLVVVYWGTVAIAIYMGKLGALSPDMAAWSPNVIFALLGVAAFFNLRS